MIARTMSATNPNEEKTQTHHAARDQLEAEGNPPHAGIVGHVQTDAD